MIKGNKKTILMYVVSAILVTVLIVFGLRGIQNNDIFSSKISKGGKQSEKIYSEFEKKFNSNKRTVIYYASSDCGYCTLQTPILNTISEDYDMDYYYIDSSKLSLNHKNKILKALKIKHATPTTVVVENGKVIDTKVGYTPGQEYVEFFIKSGMLEKGAEYSAEKNITFIDYDEYKEVLSNEDLSVVVIGQTTCSHCIAFKPALNSVAGEYDITINYLDLTDLSEEENDKFFENLKGLGYNDPDYLEDGSFGTPTTFIIENGKIINYLSGEMTTSQLVKQLKKNNVIK